MDKELNWGEHAPPSKAWPLRLIIFCGLSRGGTKKLVINSWKRQFGNLVDIERRGIKYRLDIENNTTDRSILASSKECDGAELKALTNACRGGLFLDVGANVGYYSLTLAAAGAKVLAIEPNPPTLGRLRFNVGINGLEEKITILPVGIGEEGSFELFSTGDLGTASLLRQSEASKSVTIPTRPLLDLLKEENIEQIAGMKIDIEGMEDRALMPFLRDAPRSLWPSVIVIEHCNKTDWETDVITHLHDRSYVELARTRGNTILKLD
jgi:FkbM family methyltransferase